MSNEDGFLCEISSFENYCIKESYFVISYFGRGLIFWMGFVTFCNKNLSPRPKYEITKYILFYLQQLYLICSNFFICSMSPVGHHTHHILAITRQFISLQQDKNHSQKLRWPSLLMSKLTNLTLIGRGRLLHSVQSWAETLYTIRQMVSRIVPEARFFEQGCD